MINTLQAILDYVEELRMSFEEPRPRQVWKPMFANDEKGWKRFCHGVSEEPVDVSEETPIIDNSEIVIEDEASLVEEGESTLEEPQRKIDKYHKIPLEGYLPTQEIMLQLDQKTIFTLLQHHLKWLFKDEFTFRHASWIFSLLSYASDVLMAEEISLLRQFCRKCKVLRSDLWKIISQETSSTEIDIRIIYLNMFVIIISDFYGQSDLQDNISTEPPKSNHIKRYTVQEIYDIYQTGTISPIPFNAVNEAMY